MKKNEVTRLYNFSDAQLVAIGNEKIAFMRRDLADFAFFGLGEPQFTALETKIDAFSNLVTDIESASNQVQITEEKDAKAEELKMAIRSVMTRVAQKNGEKSSRYKNYGVDALSKQSDADLIITAKRVVRVGTNNLDDLASVGLTMGLLENISNINTQFETLLIDQKLKIGERDIEQEDRVEAGNVIYTDLVTYTKTGQDIWVSKEVAKYNDYVIYNTESGENPDEPTDNL